MPKIIDRIIKEKKALIASEVESVRNGIGWTTFNLYTEEAERGELTAVVIVDVLIALAKAGLLYDDQVVPDDQLLGEDRPSIGKVIVVDGLLVTEDF